MQDNIGHTAPAIADTDHAVHQKAKAEERHRQAAKRATQLRNDPVLRGINKLAFSATPKKLLPEARTDISLDGEIPERAKEYADPASIQSLFSPGRYLCELYNVAKELHGENSELHIDKRRPDLKELVLNDSNMNKEVSSLDILLTVLETKAPLADLAKNTETRANDTSFTLPYDDNLMVINAILEDKSTSLREIAALLTENNDPWKNAITPALIQEQLGLNPASYALIKIENKLDDNSAKRLAHATQLSVKQLQWLNKNAIESNKEQKSSKDGVLAIISEYHRLNQRYGLSVDQFVAIINAVNTQSNENETSFFAHTFPTLEVDAGFNFNNQGSWEVIMRKALGITAEELLRIAQYCFGQDNLSNLTMDSYKFGQLYRMAIIPRTLGLSFSQAEYLWRLDNAENVMEKIAQGDALTVINAITLLENTLQWMNQQKLDIPTLQAMLTTQYSTTATPELFNFLFNIYQTLGKQVYSETLKTNLCRSLANGFHLKANVVAGLISWLEMNNIGFTLESFWQNIAMTFAEEPTLHSLEVHQPLIKQCQQLSQYALIAQWAALSEQEIELILLPNGLDNRSIKPLPSIRLLKLLSEFKLWQQATTVSLAELLDVLKQLITDVNEKLENLKGAAKKTISSTEKKINELNIKIKALNSESEKFIAVSNSSDFHQGPNGFHTIYYGYYEQEISNAENERDDSKEQLEQAKKNLDLLLSKKWKPKTIKYLAEIYNWDVTVTKNLFADVFKEKFDDGFASLIKLKNHIAISEKLKISVETLVKTKNYIFDSKNDELEEIANKLMVNI